MGNQAYAGLGAKFQYSDMAMSPTWTTVPGMGDLTGPARTRSNIDVTTLDSEDGYSQYIGGLRDGGEMSGDMMYYPGNAAQNAIQDMFDTQITDQDFRILYDALPGDPCIYFSGWVTALSLATPINDALKKSLTIKVTGPVTEGPA